MSRDDLNRSLEELRAEITRLDVKDAPAKARVERLIADLEHQLAHPNDDDHRTTLVEGLPDLVEQLEVEHPQFTDIVNRVMVALSSMGI